MNRRAIIIAVCVFVGFLVNVLVAWAAVRFAPEPRETDTYRHWFTDVWPGPVPANWPPVTRGRYENACGYSTFWRTEQTVQENWKLYHQHLAGWPMCSLRSDELVILNPTAYPGVNSWSPEGLRGGLTTEGLASKANGYWRFTRIATVTPRFTHYELAVYPTWPVWPGTIVNTALYGSFCLGFISVLSFARRGRRTRRDLCGVCAYPTAGLSICPECGTPVRAPSKITQQSAPQADVP